MATTYAYQVRDRAGKVISGKLEADNQAAVAGRLKEMGYAPISIKESSAGMKRELKVPGFGTKSVKLKDLAIFSRQFATMINAGLSLIRALNILTEQTESAELKRVLTEVRNDVETGNALSVSMGKHPKAFPPLMINMTKAGEVGGFLDSVMLQIAENYEAEVKLKGKVKAAMTYPVVVFVMAIIMCSGMLIFIVPVMAKMFESLGGELPAPTKVLIVLSNVLKKTAPLLVIGGLVLARVIKTVKHKDGFRNVVDPLKLKTPVFGDLWQKIALARFARNLGTMMKSGVPILQSLDIVADTTGNIVLARAIRDVQESVRTGEAISAPLVNHKVFPAMVVQMMSVGEDTGALDNMLLKLAQFYDQEVESTTEALTALIEPIMIGVLGGIVGAMIIAMYLPIFKIFEIIK